jgi:hypothetical protein
MSQLATVFGWSQETWAVVASLLAVAVALPSVGIAWWSHRTSRDAVEQAERSAGAAERSAEAAERSAELQREALAIEKRRDQRELLESFKALAPQWEAIEDGAGGYFRSDAERMRGALRNAGLMTATVHAAYLDCDGRRAAVRMRCDSPQGGGGWAETVHVAPQSVLELECDLGGIQLRTTARPSLYMDFEPLGADTGLFAVTVELLRTGETVSGDAAWRVGRIRGGVLA